MAALVFNIAHGRVPELFLRGPAGILLLLTSAEADSVLQDHDTLEDLLAAPGNTEMGDASYARLTGVEGIVEVDDALDEAWVVIADQTWPNLAGASIVKGILAYELGASDAQRVPLTMFDWPMNPDGNDATLRFP